MIRHLRDSTVAPAKPLKGAVKQKFEAMQAEKEMKEMNEGGEEGGEEEEVDDDECLEEEEEEVEVKKKPAMRVVGDPVRRCNGKMPTGDEEVLFMGECKSQKQRLLEELTQQIEALEIKWLPELVNTGCLSMCMWN